MKKDKRLESQKRLQHILQSIERIHTFLDEKSYESFCSDNLTQDATLFQFSIIGEAINHVEPEILNKYDYPWYKVRSLRNLIAHEYFNIKLSAIWQVFKNDLPELEKVIRTIVNVEFETP